MGRGRGKGSCSRCRRTLARVACDAFVASCVASVLTSPLASGLAAVVQANMHCGKDVETPYTFEYTNTQHRDRLYMALANELKSWWDAYAFYFYYAFYAIKVSLLELPFEGFLNLGDEIFFSTASSDSLHTESDSLILDWNLYSFCIFTSLCVFVFIGGSW